MHRVFGLTRKMTGSTAGRQDTKKESPLLRCCGAGAIHFDKGAATYSPTFAVPSARRGLTSLFGMGRGGTPVLSTTLVSFSLPLSGCFYPGGNV